MADAREAEWDLLEKSMPSADASRGEGEEAARGRGGEANAREDDRRRRRPGARASATGMTISTVSGRPDTGANESRDGIGGVGGGRGRGRGTRIETEEGGGGDEGGRGRETKRGHVDAGARGGARATKTGERGGQTA